MSDEIHIILSLIPILIFIFYTIHLLIKRRVKCINAEFFNLFILQVFEIFLYAILMAVVITIFTIMTIFYKYVEIPEEEDTDGAMPLEEKTGNVNLAYKKDEK